MYSDLDTIFEETQKGFEGLRIYKEPPGILQERG
jgi:hypothetical protein